MDGWGILIRVRVYGPDLHRFYGCCVNMVVDVGVSVSVVFLLISTDRRAL